ncbi:MAG: hypothetical protein CSA62_09800 [Planctomycetota bacterium]|nr:MAG: hypothetical protein CSA62_09800 [Planctomycetota bacterium]
MFLALRHLLLLTLAGVLLGSRPLPAQQRPIQLAGSGLKSLDQEAVQRLAEQALGRVEAQLDRKLQGQLRLFVVEREEQLDPELRPHFHDWTVALAHTRSGRVDVLLPRVRSEPPGDLETVLRHEFVHVLLGQLEIEASGGTKHLPTWLHEGLAQFCAGQGLFPSYEEALAFRAATDTLPRFYHLKRGFPKDATMSRIAYAQSLSFLTFCVRRIGLESILEACRGWLSGRYSSIDHALAQETGQSFGTLAAEWRKELASGGNLLRQLGQNCFEVLIWLCVPLLLIVVWKRVQDGQRMRERLERIERLEDAALERVRILEDAPEVGMHEPRQELLLGEGEYVEEEASDEEEGPPWPGRTQ